MKKGWEVKRLGDVCELITKGTTPTSLGFQFVDSGVNFIKVESLTEAGEIVPQKVAYITKECHEALRRSQLKENDILFSIAGALGRIGIVGREIVPANTNQALAIVRLAENCGLTVSFLAKYFNSEFILREIERLKGGAAQQNLSLGQLNELSIPLPPLPEQQRIVAILDEAFAAIAKAKANAEQNLKNAKELFESFLQGVFEQRGEGWEEKRFEEICKLTRGHNPPKSKFINEEREGYVRFYQIRDGGTDNYAVWVPDTPQLHKVAPDEILMVAYRHIGRVFRGVSGAFNVALCKISNRDRSVLNDDFLYYLIPTDIVKGELMKRSERSLIPSMSVEHLKEITIPLPPLAEQITIVQKLDALSAETMRLEAIHQQKIVALDELKKTLLQKAFRGELNTEKSIRI